jgi:FkbM family methyltransferase
MPFISYAQNYEDVILWRALHDVEKGFYVDVGAADPTELSVTRAFYDRGWSGINVEPLDEYFEKLKQARPRDTNLKVAAGREAGIRSLHTFAGTGLSTFNPEIAARHESAGWKVSKTVVPVLTLAKILEDCAPSTIHFLKIDVEGAEAEVLQGLNLSRVRPWIILTEATEPFSTESTRDEWEHFVIGQGYEFAYFDGLNCFYVAAEVSRLKEKLTVPPNFFDNFVRWSEVVTRNRVTLLEEELADSRNRANGLEEAVGERLREVTTLRNALEAEQAEKIQIQQRNQELEQIVATPGIVRALRGLRQQGDRITGGGLRSLTRRTFEKVIRRAMEQPQILAAARRVLKPFPKFSTTLYNVATKAEEVPAALPPKSLPSDEVAMADALPASARRTYRTLRSLILEAEAADRSK